MLEMKNVVKTFGHVTALDNLSLTVPKGAVYGLVGPNGAGKSTAIRHLTGIYRPDKGEVTLEGMPVFENPGAKGRIGYIPDDVFYYPGATLEEMRKFYKGFTPSLTMPCLPGSMRFFSCLPTPPSAAIPRVCRSRRPST